MAYRMSVLTRGFLKSEKKKNTYRCDRRGVLLSLDLLHLRRTLREFSKGGQLYSLSKHGPLRLASPADTWFKGSLNKLDMGPNVLVNPFNDGFLKY